MPAPTTVQVAFWIQLGTLMVGVLRQIFTLDLTDWLHGLEVGYARRASTPMPVALEIGVTAWYTALFIAIFLLWLWITFGLRRGARSARLLVTISTLVGLVFLVTHVDIAVIIGSIVDLGATVLLWLPSSNRFFAAVAVERKQYRLDRAALAS